MKRYRMLLIVLLVGSLWAQAMPLPSDSTIEVADRMPHHRPRVARAAGQKRLRRSPSEQQSVGDKNIAPRGLLILVNFQDVQFLPENDWAAFEAFANAEQYDYEGATGSAREYFRAQSAGQYVPQFDVVGPVTLPHEMAYYGANDADGYDQNTGDFLMDAVRLADEMGVDFTLYDNNKDGYIDFVYLIYAGYGEADSYLPNTIWPHNWDLINNLAYGYTRQTEYYYRSEKDYRLPKFDGLYLNDYACSSCLRRNGTRSGIGTMCHEFGHLLGLPDYYAESGSEIYSYTPGSWSIMGYGCYINEGKTPCNYSAFDKYYLGWLIPTMLHHGDKVTLPADGQTAYMLTRNLEMPAFGAETPDTIYYFENRQYEGWDAYLPGHGMLVWRVIFSHDAWVYNEPNNDTLIGYTLLAADGGTPYNTRTRGGGYENIPFPGYDYSGEVIATRLTLFSRYELSDIEEKDGVISFTFRDLSQPDSPTRDEQTDANSRPEKIYRNGHIYIRRNNRYYDITGIPLSNF